jgi:hypothetical protein
MKVLALVAWVIVAIAKMWEISKLFSGGLSLTLAGGRWHSPKQIRE